MPPGNKKRKAALIREAAKKKIREAAQALLAPPPLESYWKREPQYNLEPLPVEDSGSPFALEPKVNITVTDESVHTVGDDPFLNLGEVEIKEELLELEDVGPAVDDGEADPIGQDELPLSPPPQEKYELEIENRCQFCMNLFRESGGRGIITKVKIGFVLGLRDWDTNPGPGGHPNCCENCRKMFDLFYTFKQSCLTALARPAELFVWAGKKGRSRFVDLTSNGRKKPKTSKLQQMPDLHGLGASVQQETLKPGPVSTAVQAVTTVLEGIQTNSTQEGLVPEVVSTATHSEEEVFDLTQHSAESNEPGPVSTAATHSATIVMEGIHGLETNSKQEGLVPEVVSTVTHSEEAVLTLTQHPAKSNESGTKSNYKRIEERTYCYRCQKWFVGLEVYARHKPSCIEIQQLNPQEFACSLCPRKYKNEQDFTYHINKHNGVRSLPCRREGCTKMFYYPGVRKLHEQSSHRVEEIQAICSVCGSIFKSKSALRNHLLTHGDPRFHCKICNKGFYSKANLQKHGAAHSDERKFECKVCGKRFKSHEANRVHQRIHTDEKPYVCHICGQRFTYNCLLKTHLEKGHEPVVAVPEPLAQPSVEVVPPNPVGSG